MESDYQRAYQLLYTYFGPQHWWPGETEIEIVVGAILVQNTNWQNVEKAIVNLQDAGVLSFEALAAMPIEQLAEFIRPSGFFNVKAKRLKALLCMIEEEYSSELQNLLDDELWVAREKLLSVKGVGQETADSILLYAANQPIFVVDAYTHRVFSRHNLLDEETDYESIQETFMANLAKDVQLYNEYHALIVAVAKKYCKKTKPLCDSCPLKDIGQ